MQSPVGKQSRGELVIKLGVAAVILTLAYEAYGSFSHFLPQPGAQVLRQGNVTVRRQPLTVSERYLEGADWQQTLRAGTAYTHWSFICKSDFDLQESAAKSKEGVYYFVIRGVTVNLELPVTIWLPFGIAARLREHEDGHRQICAKIYANADKIAAECATSLIGQEILARGPSPSEAREAAVREARSRLSRAYAKQTEDLSVELSDFYDKITNHGTNDVTASSGVEQALARGHL